MVSITTSVTATPTRCATRVIANRGVIVFQNLTLSCSPGLFLLGRHVRGVLGLVLTTETGPFVKDVAGRFRRVGWTTRQLEAIAFGRGGGADRSGFRSTASALWPTPERPYRFAYERRFGRLANM